jgi:dihydrofolate reductase
MRKLKLQVQMSVDGFIAGPGGEMDWMTWNWDNKLKDYVNELTAPVDTILLGRKMAGGFISHWANAASDPNNPEYGFGKKMTDTPKVVFSKTLERSQWDNTEVVTGDLAEEIHELKNRDGKDIIVYGGAGFDSSLIKENLIDDYHLFINPAVIGSGMAIFAERKNLTLVKSISFDCGIVVLQYTPNKN